MKNIQERVSESLGVHLPGDYLSFIQQYESKLATDPVVEESWISGLGNIGFVIGTTLAFRSQQPKFDINNIIIGYAGKKTIIIAKMYEEIDNFMMLDSRTGKIALIDSLGVVESDAIAQSFEEWITPHLTKKMLQEKYTSKLVVLVFKDEQKAEELRLKLIDLQRHNGIDLEDVVVVIRHATGEIKINQSHTLTKKGLAAATITGLLVGSLFMMPILGAAFGAVTGVVSAGLTDLGIENRFIEELATTLEPGSSALFVLARKSDPDAVTKEVAGFGGKVLVTSVSSEDEAMIQHILDGQPMK